MAKKFAVSDPTEIVQLHRLHREKPDLEKLYEEWVRLRPHGTGLVDLPFWALWSSMAATASVGRQHIGPPRGTVWD